MSWVKLDDHFADHPKLQGMGLSYPLAGWLYISSLCYAAKHLTDGFIPEVAVLQLATWDGIGYMGGGVSTDELADSLVAAGLWEKAVNGYRIHDYLHYNPSREAVLENRESSTKRAQEWRERNARSTDEVRTSRTPSPYKKKSTAREALRELPRDGLWWSARAAQFPDVDLLAELEKAEDWHAIDKIKNVKLFFRNWLAKAPRVQREMTADERRAALRIS